MSATTTRTRNNTDEAQFLAPETHPRAGGQDQSEMPEDLRYIALSKLVPSALNVRKSGGESIDELAMLIDSQGLLQNLIVTPQMTKQGKALGKHEVVAGCRRLRALRKLADLGKLANDEEILCKVVSKEGALAASAAENSGREAMSVADTVQAFAGMAAEGAGVEDLAVCFGITPLTVRRRLKLANVSPKLFELFRQDKMTLDQLMALAISDDHDAQERVWEGTPSYERHESNLRRQLLGREIDVSRDPVAMFVGSADYEAAGGVVVRDLFGEDGTGYIRDAELLYRLAAAKLDKQAEELRKEGWAWVEARTSFDYSAQHRFMTAPTGLREATEKERTKLDALEKIKQDAEAKLEALYESEEPNEEEGGVLEDQADKAVQEIAKLHAKMRRYAPEVMAYSGSVVAIDHGGKVCVHRGLVKPEDRKEAVKAVAKDRHETGHGASGDGGNGETDQAALSEALQRKLTAHRTKALQVLLAGNTHAALAALVHSLLQQVVVERSYSVTSALSIRANDCDAALAQFADDIEASRAWGELQSQLHGLRERLPQDAEALLPWLIAQSQGALLDMLALCTARTLNTVTARAERHPSDALARAVGLDMADWWSPTGPSYLAQVPKAKIVEAVTEAVSAEQGTALSKLKKGEAVAKAEALLAGTRWLPSTLRAAQG